MASEQRAEDKGAKARKPDERAKWRRDLVIIVAIFLALLAGYAVDQRNTRQNNRDAILDAVTANCRTNLEQDERLDKLITLFVGLARAGLKDASAEQREQSRAFLRDFANAPMPTPCAVQRQRVEDRLN